MPTLNQILGASNVADILEQEELDEISAQVIAGYRADEISREEWKARNKNAMDLALQVMDEKTTPWTNASNVKFPLITIGAIQFSSRTYPAMVNGTDIVRCRTYGEDPNGQKMQRAVRVSKHMTYQILEEDEGWEEEFDKLLMSLPIMGCGFKKTYFDAQLGHNVSINVFPKNLVVDYYARSLESAKRITHILEYYKNEIIEKMRAGIYSEFDIAEEPQHSHDESDQRQGINNASTEATLIVLEQHTWLDLDEDGYEEPYIVTVLENKGKVLRIVPRYFEANVQRYKGRISKITPIHYFTKYPFIPAPDGGFYDLGFGSLLGPITEAINSLVNQLIDAGTLANMPSGFLGRGARLQGGEYRFKGGEFKQLKSTGDDLRKNIFMLPIKEPSQTLFQLLNLLITYGERISGVTDMMAGQTPGQNTPATTAMAALEQGQKVFSGIHKRVYRSLRDEFRKLYFLNRHYLNPQTYFQFLDGSDNMAYRDDYLGDPTDVKPSADPNVSSTQQRIAKAMLIKENAMKALSPFDGYQVEHRILEAAEIPDIDMILPDPKGKNAIKPPPDPKIEIESAKFQRDSEIASEEMRIKAMLADAQIAQMETQAILNLEKASAAGAGTEIAQYQTEIKAFQEKRAQLQVLIDDAHKQRELAGMAGTPNNQNPNAVSQG